MKQKTIRLVVMVVMSALILAACQAESNDVATLGDAESAPVETPQANTSAPALDNEAMMLAFTDCLREQGIDVLDPVVDADGNVQQPERVQGGKGDKEAMEDTWETCEHHLEGFAWNKEGTDASEQAEQLDQYVALATCLREKGYDVGDPTAETLDQWGTDFKAAINWDDPDALADYEECSGETVGMGGGK